MRLMLEHELLDFCMVSRVASVVEATCFVPGATHEPASAGDQEHFKAVFGALIVDVTLDQYHEPVRGNTLCLKIFAHIEVPHIPIIHRSFIVLCALMEEH